jgi:adenylate cyclase
VASVRRLSAIMFTDMVGSTAAAQADESRALKLRDEQAELVRPLFTAHHGREIKSMGDGFLAEFDSALRAVQCAIDIQQHLHERNSQSGVARIELRIGIHLGDVEQRQSDIFGDAVNIASRIEPLASPGGVCVSGEVFSQIRNKIPNPLEKLPPKALKGLQVSIDIYRVVLPWNDRAPPPGPEGPSRLAVLPFANMSPDPADMFFADGLTEELITVLSQVRDLRVIARTSVMQYKTTTKTVAQIGPELGVSSVLEGSVRRAGNRLRITAQLIEVGSDEHLWAKSFDRELDDVFAIQSEIAKQVADALQIELGKSEAARLESRPTVRADSYLAYLKGRTLQQDPSRASLEAAKVQFELALTLDPNNAAAHAGLATTVRKFGIWFADGSERSWMEQVRRSVARAIELDPNLAEAHYSLALIHHSDLDPIAAEKEVELALALDPSYAEAHWFYAQLLGNKLRVDEALQEFALAEAADPLWGQNLWLFASALSWRGRFDEALVRVRKLGEVAPSWWLSAQTLATYHLARNELPQALDALRKVEELIEEPRWKPLNRALRYALSGEPEKALEILRHEETLPTFGQSAVYVASVYAELGKLDDCFRWLETAYSNHNLPIFLLRFDPREERIRQDPRFDLLLKKMNLA